jgi:dTDP-4-amino-4,6-dideoxygalactose transaminase
VLPEQRLNVKRAQIMAELDTAGIGSGVHYPAIHLFKLYRGLGWKEGALPQAEYVCRNILTLPMYPTMTNADVERVVDSLITSIRNHLN